MKTRPNPALVVVLLSGVYLLVTSTVFLHDSLFLFDTKRILQLVLFAIILLIAMTWPPLRKSTLRQLNRLSISNWVVLFGFFSIGIVSSLRLVHPSYALVDVAMMFNMLVLIAVVAGSRELSGRAFDTWAVISLVVLGLAVAVQEFAGFIVGWIFGNEFNYTQSLVHFAHPRFYNQLQTWSIPVIAALPLLFPDKRWVKPACVGLLGLQWFFVAAIAARGTAVSLLIAMLFIAIWLPSQRMFWIRYQLAGLIAGILIFSAVLFLNDVFIPESRSGEFLAHSAGRELIHTSGRSAFWRLSIRDAINNPVLGTGPTQYACDSEIWVPAHPHSFPLRIMGEWGIIAAMLLFSFIAVVGWKFLHHLKFGAGREPADPPLKAILGISLVAGFIHACLSGILIMPASQVILILVVGWTLSICDAGQARPGKQTHTRYVLFLGLILSTAILAFAGREVTVLSERTSYAGVNDVMLPRFWQNGRVCEYRYSDP